MNICVVSHSFPTTKTIDFVFVEQLCKQFADQGNVVTIIAPQSLTKILFRGFPKVKYKTTITTSLGNNLFLYRPTWISFGNFKLFRKISDKSFDNAIYRCLSRQKMHFDVLYAHFWAQAKSVLPYAKLLNIPMFVVAGEGELVTHKSMSYESICEIKLHTKGVICVATKSMRESIDAGFATFDMCKVFPNAVDQSVFRILNKEEMRKKHGFNKDDFIVAFVGQWNNRKGVQRLCDALNILNNTNIKAMFIGRGPEKPIYDQIVFQGTVKHDDLPEYLNCADVFVLPTINEGCSNAIVEAMACGLPIVSSNMEFNKDILNEKNAILINPLNINEIASAISRLYSSQELRQELCRASLNKAKELTLPARASRIIEYISSKIN